ncbi:MAG: type II secretion system F family protein [Akkermansiaceae bacterium]|jgi:general secretion pathway protein F|nr:type II secretion system F family protein [Luteolibacter sp.]
MPQFSYKALATNGTVSTGEVEASDRSEALRVLDKRGLQPVTVKESAKFLTKKETAKPKPRESVSDKTEVSADGTIKLKRAEVILFTEELSDMIGAGLQLEPALKSMEMRQELGSLKDVSRRIREIVRDGVNFSVALKKVSPSFGPLYCSLAAAGEASGALDTILKRQAYYLKTLAELQSKLILAMIYPSFLILMGLGVGVVFVTLLIPQLSELIKNTPGGKLPWAINGLMYIADFIKTWWVVILLLVIGGSLFFKAWKDNEENRPTWDKMKLKIPLIGAVIASRFYVQFLETMANLVGNGLPLLRALELSRDATQNLAIRKNLNDVIAQVGDGRAFSKAMIRSESFPPLLIDMIAVGEQTGKIDLSLRRAAERYDKELNKDIQRIMALIMPAVLIFMALLIGTFAYLMITAIFQTMSNLR